VISCAFSLYLIEDKNKTGFEQCQLCTQPSM
jgi:hypothetical protein